MKTLGFFGAMNRDVVAAVSAEAVIAALSIDAKPLLETAVTDAVAAQGAGLLMAAGAIDVLGGSAFNAARIAAFLTSKQPNLNVAYLGVAGQIDGGQRHLAALTQWGVETDNVISSASPPATCLAMVGPRGRTLLTASGANADIAAILRSERERFVRALVRCDVVHVTSYLDPDTPALIADILVAARQDNPDLRVSLDPGSAWVSPGGDGFWRLVGEADILHLNTEEFAHLGGEAVADEILQRMRCADPVIVARSHLGCSVFRDGAVQRLANALSLPAELVLDATGAGDTFCGGVLWAHLGQGADLLDAAQFGFELARRKVQVSGPLTEEQVHAALRVDL